MWKFRLQVLRYMSRVQVVQSIVEIFVLVEKALHIGHCVDQFSVFLQEKGRERVLDVV